MISVSARFDIFYEIPYRRCQFCGTPNAQESWWELDIPITPKMGISGFQETHLREILLLGVWVVVILGNVGNIYFILLKLILFIILNILLFTFNNYKSYYVHYNYKIDPSVFMEYRRYAAAIGLPNSDIAMRPMANILRENGSSITLRSRNLGCC